MKFPQLSAVLLLAVLFFYAGCSSPVSPERYSISYDGNGSDGGTVPASFTYAEGSSAVISGNTGDLAKTGRFFLNWNTARDGSGSTYNPGESVTIAQDMILYAIWAEGPIFYAQRVTDNLIYAVDAELLVNGTSCIIYADRKINFSQADAEAIRIEYEGNIKTDIIGTFGPYTYFDRNPNGKIILLLLDIVDGYNSQSSTGYVAGYFDPINMFAKASNPKSNEAAMLYIDTYPGWNTSNPASLYSTIAHELQHLINYSRIYNYQSNGTILKREQDLWINEGLSSAAEYVYKNTYQDSRVTYFNRDPYRTIAHGNNFFVWNGYWENAVGDVLANYSTVYLFFQWLRIHSNKDTLIYKDIINSDYSDYHAVTDAASQIDINFKDNWNLLLSTWMWANIKVNGNGLEGYQGYERTEKPQWKAINEYHKQQPISYWSLSPGEGVFSIKTSGSINNSNTGNIRYTNQSCSPYYNYVKGDTGPYQTYLTVNVNTVISGADEMGNVAMNAAGDYSRDISPGAENNMDGIFQDPYPISFGDRQREIQAEKNKGPSSRNSGGEYYKK